MHVSNLGQLAHESAISWFWFMKDLAWVAVDQGFSPCCLSSSRKVTQACLYSGNMSKAAREDKPWCAISFQDYAFVMFVTIPFTKARCEVSLNSKDEKRFHLLMRGK